MDRSKSSRNGVHNANGLVWEPVWIDRTIGRSIDRRRTRGWILPSDRREDGEAAGGIRTRKRHDDDDDDDDDDVGGCAYDI